ncbi:MAG TPA: phytanoyl-CoA dioxygenase family protein [Candidatus Acidoferrum sp.]|nr:phytanoyl-CoA dioxygenase family protein [Candidatus Acidoferrum sp.]
MYLKSCWARAQALYRGQQPADPGDPALDRTLWNLLRLPPEPVWRHLLHAREDFPAFEAWIERTTGTLPSPTLVQRFNSVVTGRYQRPVYAAPSADLLTGDELDCWHTQGYVIVRGAVPRADCAATVALLCSELGIDRDDASNWYTPHPLRQGNMVQLFHHPQLERNRRSPRIRRAFEQLWLCNELLPSADRLGFNPPQTPTHPFQGPDLHWDIPLHPPVTFGTQGILYLSDTAAGQGAFTLVPGFHRKLEPWLQTLPGGEPPTLPELHALGSMPLPANAGDLIIWHHALPHGSRPNTATVPRFVQYINYQPLDVSLAS